MARYKIADMSNGSYALRFATDDTDDKDLHSVPVNLTAYEMDALSKEQLLAVAFERLLVAIDTLEDHGPVPDVSEPEGGHDIGDQSGYEPGLGDADNHMANAQADAKTRQDMQDAEFKPDAQDGDTDPSVGVKPVDGNAHTAGEATVDADAQKTLGAAK